MKAFVVGNIAMDETFAVERLPCEGESIFGTQASTDLGGKGTNQAIVLARCGIETVLVAATGADAQAERMRSVLAQERVIPRLKTISRLPSDRSIVIKDAAGGNANITTVDCAKSLSAEDVFERMADADAGDLVVLQGNLAVSTTGQVIAMAKKRDMQVVLNPSPLEAGIESFLAEVNTLFLNQHEALQITGFRGNAAVRDLLGCGIETVILSQGGKGALLGTPAGISTVSATACNVVDTTGAGDTLQSVALAAAALRACTVDVRTLEIATRAAALTVSRFGTRRAFPSEAELQDLMAS